MVKDRLPICERKRLRRPGLNFLGVYIIWLNCDNDIKQPFREKASKLAMLLCASRLIFHVERHQNIYNDEGIKILNYNITLLHPVID